ncbi:Predicted outer membrane lipoprotein [Legionella donaldsonii]|uniref:Predicted outer membrane lipoprotein n=1 Tax=Legionella donaldsonii TaxID=45060 RepID=A0A378J9R3_9GAMM|nr:Predicted outer membrane lipoprotein [Legionella donaldsonii]
MWYFSWILGTGLACTFAVLNAMWLELHENDKAADLSKSSDQGVPINT